MKKFNVVKEDFCLYHLTSQRRRQSVLVGVNYHKACFAHGQRSIAEHRERILRQGQQCIGVCLLQFLNGNLVNVVVTLGIRFTPVPQVVLVKLLKRSNGGNRHKSVPSAVPNLVLYIAFLIARSRIAELGLETVVQHKTAKSIRENAFISTQNLGNSGGHVVETESGRYAANALKDSPHTFQQALLILRGEGLCVTLVGIRERDGQCVTLLLLSNRVVIQKLTEVYLSAY